METDMWILIICMHFLMGYHYTHTHLCRTFCLSFRRKRTSEVDLHEHPCGSFCGLSVAPLWAGVWDFAFACSLWAPAQLIYLCFCRSSLYWEVFWNHTNLSNLNCAMQPWPLKSLHSISLPHSCIMTCRARQACANMRDWKQVMWQGTLNKCNFNEAQPSLNTAGKNRHTRVASHGSMYSVLCKNGTSIMHNSYTAWLSSNRNTELGSTCCSVQSRHQLTAK